MNIIAVTHETFWPVKGGGGSRVFWTIKKMLERGHKVTLYAPCESTDGLMDALPGLNFINGGTIGRFKSKNKELVYLKFMLRLSKFLIYSKAECIYTHIAISALPSVLLGKLKGIPVVFDVDDIISGLSSNKFISKFGPHIEFAVARWSKRVICMSMALKEVMEKHRAGDVIHIPHGVDLSLFKSREPVKENIIVYCGGIEPHDGVWLIPEAAERVIKKFPDIIFLIIGEGRGLAEVKKLVGNKKLGRNFSFTGWVNHENIPEYLNKARIGLITHIRSSATEIALVVKGLEYMAMGLPVIAPDLKGMREEIGENERGLLFKPEDSEDLANKIIHLLEDHELQKEMGKKGRKFIENNFIWERNAERIVQVCEDIE
ncbi:MAG: glycosyltransferase family 4 protein [Nitrospinae bacterium]|nr:glycosyltransferase family 4 protein [Nitrospinota bacterium]